MLYSISKPDDIKKIFDGLKTPIFYVTNNVDKAVGLEDIIPNYHIICIDYDDEADYLEKAGVKVFCLEKEIGKKNSIFRNSALLLGQEIVQKYIKENTPKGEQAAIVVFKPSLAAEKIARENNWKILNNSAVFSREMENKHNFLFIAKSLNIRIPKAEILDLSQTNYQELKGRYGHFVIQFRFGNAGSSTFIIKNNDEYDKFLNIFSSNFTGKEKFIVKVSKFIYGVPATVNACVGSQNIYIGKPCYQITGEKLCTNNRSTTCGNDWGELAVTEKISAEIDEVGQKIGKYLRKKGYKGIFGLDFIINEKDKKVYLIEINPRFVASMPFYTKLEIKNSVFPLVALHFFEFLGVKYDIDLSVKKMFNKNSLNISGSQLVLRNKEKATCAPIGEMKSGVYSLEDGKLIFLRSGYSPLDLNRSNEFIVLTATKGRKIKSENEVARIESLVSFVSPDHRLIGDAELIVKDIYDKLKLEIL